MEPRETARAVEETTSPEHVDEEIESLLLSLEEKPEPASAEEPSATRPARQESRHRRLARRRHHRRYLNQFDLFVVVTAAVLGLAVGLLTVFLVNV